jgi:hypothetical protein
MNASRDKKRRFPAKTSGTGICANGCANFTAVAPLLLPTIAIEN